MSDTGSLGKKRVIQAIIEKLKEELAITQASAAAAHEAATGSESKAENQYDTRGLEASYLAGAQMRRGADIEKHIALYRSLLETCEARAASVGPGTLVQVEHQGRNSTYFVMNEGGGVTLRLDGCTVNVITPRAPLGDALLGHRAGDVVDVEMQGGVRQYLVISVD